MDVNVSLALGIPVHFRFCETEECGDGNDRALLTLYADVKGAGAQFTMDAATAETPAQACLAEYQKVCFCFHFSRVRPYGEVRNLCDFVVDALDREGWKETPFMEEFPDCGSSILDLHDTREMTFSGRPEKADFPEKPAVEGYNAARGFSVVVEKTEKTTEFTQDELDQLFSLTKTFTEMVFHREIPLIKE
jgi:hypothetical protein